MTELRAAVDAVRSWHLARIERLMSELRRENERRLLWHFFGVGR